MKPGTFRILLVWLDAERVYADAVLEEELLPEHVAALDSAGAGRRKGFLLLARRNWELEFQARRVRMPRQVQGLFQMPEGQAVDRLLGHEDGGGKWHPGLAGLQQAEARVLRLRVIDRLAPKDIAWALDVKRGTVDNHLYEAHRKLRVAFGLPPRRVRGVVFAAVKSARSGGQVAI